MPRRRGRSLTRDDVIEAAIQCIDQEGAKALGVNRVARQLKIKPPSLYNHIQGNDDMRRAVAMQGWAQILELHRKAAEKEQGLDLLKTLARSFRDFAKERPGLFEITTSTFMDPEDVDFAPIGEEFVGYYAGALKPFGLSDEDILAHCVMTRGALQGFISLEAMGQLEATPGLADRTFEFMLTTLTDAAYRDGAKKGKGVNQAAQAVAAPN